MEASQRIDLLNFLLEEATLKIELLQRALVAHEPAWEENQHPAPGMPRSPEQYHLQVEQAWWEKARHGLMSARAAFEHIELSERQRGITTKRLWR